MRTPAVQMADKQLTVCYRINIYLPSSEAMLTSLNILSRLCWRVGSVANKRARRCIRCMWEACEQRVHRTETLLLLTGCFWPSPVFLQMAAGQQRESRGAWLFNKLPMKHFFISNLPTEVLVLFTKLIFSVGHMPSWYIT